MKITKKFVKSNVRSGNALPGSTLSLVIFSAACNELLGYDAHGNALTVRDRILRNMEKWGWIEYRGCAMLTVLGYKNL